MPLDTASPSESEVRGESGVMKNNGRLKIATQIAAIMPTARSGSCRAGSRPKSGCGFQLQAYRKNRNSAMPKTLANARPQPLRNPMRAGGAMFGSMAFRKMPEYSQKSSPPTSPSTMSHRPLVMPGVAYQSTTMLGMPMRSEAMSHGLRRPPASAMAPSTGALRAMRIDAPDVM